MQDEDTPYQKWETAQIQLHKGSGWTGKVETALKCKVRLRINDFSIHRFLRDCFHQTRMIFNQEKDCD
jgi:hypothetical protein